MNRGNGSAEESRLGGRDDGEFWRLPTASDFYRQRRHHCRATEIGRWLGTRAGDRGGEQVHTLEGVVLLALMIAFTFAMALSRYEARRDAVLSEANAIGTTALRARLLPEPPRSETLNLLRDYVNMRLEAAKGMGSKRDFDAAVARSSEIQEALWQKAMAVAGKNQDLVPTDCSSIR